MRPVPRLFAAAVQSSEPHSNRPETAGSALVGGRQAGGQLGARVPGSGHQESSLRSHLGRTAKAGSANAQVKLKTRKRLSGRYWELSRSMQ